MNSSSKKRSILAETFVAKQPCLGRPLLTQLIEKVLEKVHQTLSYKAGQITVANDCSLKLEQTKQNSEQNVCKINICCCNVRTLLDLASSKHTEQRAALVSRELGRLNIDIAALSETHLSEED